MNCVTQAYNRANYLTGKVHEENPQADMDQMKRLGKSLFEVLEPFYKDNVKKYQPLIGNLMSSLKNEKYKENFYFSVYPSVGIR